MYILGTYRYQKHEKFNLSSYVMWGVPSKFQIRFKNRYPLRLRLVWDVSIYIRRRCLLKVKQTRSHPNFSSLSSLHFPKQPQATHLNPTTTPPAQAMGLA
jgi:hypothetical protein